MTVETNQTQFDIKFKWTTSIVYQKKDISISAWLVVLLIISIHRGLAACMSTSIDVINVLCNYKLSGVRRFSAAVRIGQGCTTTG